MRRAASATPCDDDDDNEYEGRDADGPAGDDAPWPAPKPELEFRCKSIVQSVALSPRGDMLAVGLAQQTEVYQLHANAVTSMLFELSIGADSFRSGGGRDGTSSDPPSDPEPAERLALPGGLSKRCVLSPNFVRRTSLASVIARNGDDGAASAPAASSHKPSKVHPEPASDGPPPTLPGKEADTPSVSKGSTAATTDAPTTSSSSSSSSLGSGSIAATATAAATAREAKRRETAASCAFSEESTVAAVSSRPVINRQGSRNDGLVARKARVVAPAPHRRLSRQDSHPAVGRLSRQGSKLSTASSSGGRGGAPIGAPNRPSLPARLPSNASLWSVATEYNDSSPTSYVTSDPLFELRPLLLLPDCKVELGGIALRPYGTGGAVLAVAGGNRVHVVDLLTGTSLRTTTYAADARPRSVALSSDGRFVLSGHFDFYVRLHYAMTGCSAVAYGSRGSRQYTVRSVHLSADSRLLAVGCEQRGAGLCQIFEVATALLLGEWPVPTVVECVQFAPDGRTLAVSARGVPLELYAAAKPFPRLCRLPTFSTSGAPNLWRCAWSADGAVLAVSSWDGAPESVGLFRVRPPRDADDDAPEAWGEAAPAPLAPARLDGVADGAAAGEGHADHGAALQLMCRLQWTSQVYCVALDWHGEHCAVAGRGATVSLYASRSGIADGAGQQQPLWVFQHPDAYAQAAARGTRIEPKPATKPSFAP